MKKLVIYLCTGVMVLGLTACGGNQEDSAPSTEQTQTVESQPATEGIRKQKILLLQKILQQPEKVQPVNTWMFPMAGVRK